MPANEWPRRCRRPISCSRSRCAGRYTPTRPRRVGGGSNPIAWYSRIVRTGNADRRASSSTESSGASTRSTIPVITVTVITVTITCEEITAALLQSWPDVDTKEAEVLTGGQWATMLRLRVAGTPDGVPADLVLRV